MDTKKLTAVEWLEKQLTTEQWNELQYILYKSKQMEKHSIENAFQAGWLEHHWYGNTNGENENSYDGDGEKYYNNKYNISSK